jgi:hypothetical protein
MQPESIRKFTLFYLGSLAVSLVATLINYDQVVDSVARETAAAGVELGAGAVVGSMALGAAITLLLWYLAARKGFAIAKWIIVGFFLLSLYGAVGVFAGGISASDALGLVSLALQAAAIYFLFQPDAKAWFSSERTAAEPLED